MRDILLSEEVGEINHYRRVKIMKVEKSTTERIKSTSRVLAVLFKVARIFCFVGIGALSAGILFIMFFGDVDLIVLGGKTVVHSPFAMLNIEGVDSWQIIFMAVAGLVSLILLSVLFKDARDIFKDISVDSSPFEIKQVKRIRKIAVFYFIVSLLGFQTMDFSFSYTMNFVGIVGALMFWCISLIFEYGCQLQKESDETL